MDICISCQDRNVNSFSCCKLTTDACSNSMIIHLLRSCLDRSLILLIGICFVITYVGYFHQTGKFASIEVMFLACACVTNACARVFLVLCVHEA